MAEEKPSFNIIDLQNLIRIIDVLVGRGNVKGEEMSIIGASRDRAVAFIEANLPKNPSDHDGSAEQVSESAPVEAAAPEVKKTKKKNS